MRNEHEFEKKSFLSLLKLIIIIICDDRAASYKVPPPSLIQNDIDVHHQL